ncbi:MAG: T9SS type A sorting domain-containing protein [Calditrichae bacterium]|nr:T9SS type A sorting domain-containing protein [Calditrichia bacterium]
MKKFFGIQSVTFLLLISVVFSNAEPPVVVVLGSSTAYGKWADPMATESWVAQYRSHMESSFPGAVVINLGVPGYTTYDILPDGYYVPHRGEYVNETTNISAALTYSPTAILINLPSNDAYWASIGYDGYDVSDQLTNYSIVLSEAGDIPVWISTTQPRNLNQAGRNDLIAMRDATFSAFGDKAVDFWNGIADPSGFILSQYQGWDPDNGYFDGIHLNNAGHDILTNRMIEAGAGFPDDGSTPVALNRFNGQTAANGIVLNWSTESELMNDAFLIERRTAGQEYNLIAEIKGSGSSSSRNEYEYIDENVFDGETYTYRLSDRDYTGKITIHNSVEITYNNSLVAQNPEQFRLLPAYPNPFNSTVNIHFSVPVNNGQEYETRLTIFNTLGQRIRTLYNGYLEGEYKSSWDGKDVNGAIQPSGNYFVVLQSGNHTSSQKIFLIK